MASLLTPSRLVAQDQLWPTGTALDLSALSWQTDAYPTQRFVAVHGRRALLAGYSADGLEFWAYPLQVFDRYHLSFRHEGDLASLEGNSLLQSITVTPEGEARTYIGPDFKVTEQVFVPVDAPGARIEYTVESAAPLLIDVHFTPSLNLMWPAAVGGQEEHWDGAHNGYTLDEPTHRFAAAILSPQAREHDVIENTTRRSLFTRELSLTLHPTRSAGSEAAHAQLAIAGRLSPLGQDPLALAADLQTSTHVTTLEEEARSRYRDLGVVKLHTPDPAVNRAFAWSEVALEQAWVCNPQLGCGLVAGYGPSRGARRPQYAWFFAGDAMVALPALVEEGAYSRAREVLTFVIKYQNKQSGMVWHELSQSAGYLDWARDYPYMFVHVDISFQFLSAFAVYEQATHDRVFLDASWPALTAAFRYCQTLIDPSDGLPRIPAGKEGGNEQDKLRDELTLSAGWLEAAAAFSRLAEEKGDAALAAEGRAGAALARRSIGSRYWDAQSQFWISGHLQSGAAVPDHSSGAVGLLSTGIFSPEQTEAALRELASPRFLTPWGLRSSSEAASDYDPNAYAKGSVWAATTGRAAETFWDAHQPSTALKLWSALVAWTALDSPGHMHEVLAGDFFHPERESVPEQTWSSAAFVTSTLGGLLGLEARAGQQELTFAPQLPESWMSVSVEGLRVDRSRINLQLARAPGQLSLTVEDDGPPVHLRFMPGLPAGATAARGSLTGHRLTVAMHSYGEESVASTEASIPSGRSVLTLRYSSAVSKP